MNWQREYCTRVICVLLGNAVAHPQGQYCSSLLTYRISRLLWKYLPDVAC